MKAHFSLAAAAALIALSSAACRKAADATATPQNVAAPAPATPAAPAAPAVAAAPATPAPYTGPWAVEDLVIPVNRLIRDGGRSLENGRRMFTEKACVLCHLFPGHTTGNVGPDLAGVGGRMSVEELLRAIIEPSREISSQYYALNVGMKDGTIHRGRDSGGGEQIRLGDIFDNNKIKTINREDVEWVEEDKEVSIMPAGLLTGTEQDVADLIAYLLASGNVDYQAFRPAAAPPPAAR